MTTVWFSSSVASLQVRNKHQSDAASTETFDCLAEIKTSTKMLPGTELVLSKKNTKKPPKEIHAE